MQTRLTYIMLILGLAVHDNRKIIKCQYGFISSQRRTDMFHNHIAKCHICCRVVRGEKLHLEVNKFRFVVSLLGWNSINDPI